MKQWFNRSVEMLAGIGPAKAKALAGLGIFTIGQLLEHYPRAYEDRSKLQSISELANGKYQLFLAVVTNIQERRFGRKSLLIVTVQDTSGIAKLKWFNQRFLRKKFSIGAKVRVFGKAEYKYNVWEVLNPDIESVSNSLHDPIVPIYSATEAVSQSLLRTSIRGALEQYGDLIEETIPQDIINKYSLMERRDALQTIHFPSSIEQMERARDRLVFEELFFLQYGLMLLKLRHSQARKGIQFNKDGKFVKNIEANLSFNLTSDQQAVLAEIKKDMECAAPMQRLVQGDVGSGKTVIAAIVLGKAVEKGFQGALMAPTEILAEQHYHTLAKILSPVGIKVALLTGNLTKRTKEEVLKRLANGSIDVIVGTHALIQQDVMFQALGLVITDEQHRFGVRQRACLEAKGDLCPDVLVMTATPIPRTMALTVYGDLDISQIRQLPPGRRPIKTVAINARRRGEVYTRLRNQLKEGRQAYIVCPLVDESLNIEAVSATEVYQELTTKQLSGVKCALLHGKLKSQEKEAIMKAFYQGDIQVLIATTVIEVGVNVPNATVIIIEEADRFGLAQLHQLRGRVGRGEYQSFCVLLYKADLGSIPERLKIMTETQNGFILAEKDLELRGPGQFFGTRQHGMPDLKIANIIRDTAVLIKARQAAVENITQTGTNSLLVNIIKEKIGRDILGLMNN